MRQFRALLVVATIVGIAACGSVETVDTTDAAIDAPTIDAPSIDAPIDAPIALRTVTVQVAGNGTVTSNAGGISCPGTCSATVPAGTAITLTATPQGSATFLGWSGGTCSGTTPCTFTVTADVSISASFALDYTIVVTRTGTGSGSVTSLPTGINCPGDCDQTYAAGTIVTLTATPSADSTFAGWSGGCTGTGTCDVTVNAAVAVVAQFTLKTYPLAVTVSGPGTVTSNIGGINCPGTCAVTYNHGDSVTLTATPTGAATFTGWSGACTGATCTVSMTQMRNVTATFSNVTYTVTVTRTGTGTGAVTSNVGGINCPGTCTATLSAGTAVTLTQTAATTPLSALSSFGGWSGGCAGAGTCAFTLTANTTVNAAFTLRPNTVFVTSTTVVPGNLGGLAGGDAACQARATAAGLSGTYRAWLASSAQNAATRLSPASGWTRVDGLPFVNTVADLQAGKIFYPMRIDELNRDVGDTQYLTGTFVDGSVHPTYTTCGDYTSTAGMVSNGVTTGVGYLFATWTSASCGAAQRLLCFGVDRTASVVPTPPASYRRAFLSNASFTPGGGLAAADAMCAGEASSAGLPGTYRALLATSTASAMSRFNASGAPWGRPDGILVAPTAAGFFSGVPWQSAPNATANLGSYTANNGAWSGASTPTAIGTAASTCANWTSTAGSTGYGGRSGFINVADAFGMDTGNSCAATFIRLRCLQE